MGKYSPLKDFLVSDGHEQVPMTFGEIENIIGIRLPASKRYPAWWSNNPSNNPMTREWLDAGYRTESVDIEGERLVFRRNRDVRPARVGSPGEDAKESGGATGRHPLFGCLKGTLTILPGVDLTEPADPEWGRVYDQ